MNTIVQVLGENVLTVLWDEERKEYAPISNGRRRVFMDKQELQRTLAESCGEEAAEIVLHYLEDSGVL